jgi:hypothetical protein
VGARRDLDERQRALDSQAKAPAPRLLDAQARASFLEAALQEDQARLEVLAEVRQP